MTDSTLDQRYEAVLDRYRTVTAVRHVIGLLHWDQEVSMPQGGHSVRSSQLSALSRLSHDLLTDTWITDTLADLVNADRSETEMAVLREIRREHERAVPVPSSLMEEILRLQVEAQRSWHQAKEADDFETFAPVLADIVDSHVERAQHIDPDGDPYDLLLEDRMPYVSRATVEEIFDRLEATLPDLVARLEASGTDPDVAPYQGDFETEVQFDLVREVLDSLGYDWDRGRLDSAGFTFSYATADDTRIATDFDSDDILNSILRAVHEFGIAQYHHGLPSEQYGTPLGEHRGHLVYESQARFWENHVGRSAAFWEYVFPMVQSRFPQFEDLTLEHAFQAVNDVSSETTIRTEADELTYHLHIILRFEIERSLVNGEIEVADVPEVWRRKSQDYLGVSPESHAAGCLQDVHWTGGFGSFQNYTLASVLAAQLHAAMEEDIGDIEPLVRAGEFEPITEWLSEKIYRHGQRYTTSELIRRATGEELTVEYYVEYVREKYADIYGL